MSKSALHVYNSSIQSQPSAVVHFIFDEQEPCQSEELEIKKQNFVYCLHDGFPWIGLVDEVSEEIGD